MEDSGAESLLGLQARRLLLPEQGFLVYEEVTLRHESPIVRLRERDSPSVRMVLLAVGFAFMITNFVMIPIRFTPLAGWTLGAVALAIFTGTFALSLVVRAVVRRRMRGAADIACFDANRLRFSYVEFSQSGGAIDSEVSVREILRLRLIRAFAKSKGICTWQDHIRFSQLVIDRRDGESTVIVATEGRGASLRKAARRLASAMDVPLEIVKVPKRNLPSAQQLERILRMSLWEALALLRESRRASPVVEDDDEHWMGDDESDEHEDDGSED